MRRVGGRVKEVAESALAALENTLRTRAHMTVSAFRCVSVGGRRRGVRSTSLPSTQSRAKCLLRECRRWHRKGGRGNLFCLNLYSKLSYVSRDARIVANEATSPLAASSLSSKGLPCRLHWLHWLRKKKRTPEMARLGGREPEIAPPSIKRHRYVLEDRGIAVQFPPAHCCLARQAFCNALSINRLASSRGGRLLSSPFSAYVRPWTADFESTSSQSRR
jgi:hypothetical protein